MTADLLFINANLATAIDNGQDYGAIPNSALAVSNGKISWVGSADIETHQLPAAKQIIDCAGGWLTPGFIDCHTHLIYGGNRANEFEWRQQGISYSEISARGGGINSTVTATRNASDSELLNAAQRRLDALMREGVTTVEIKSGYGLSLQQELRMLELARQLGRNNAITVATTLLAAHALPPEFSTKDEYIKHIVDDILPAAADAKLADAVDVFCEGVGFSRPQCEKVFQRAQQLGLPVKGHVEQLSDLGGATLIAQFKGLSADHIEYLRSEDVDSLKTAGTVATLLPAAFFFLRETQLPPIAALREAGVPMAVATDCNPGTAPQASLLTAMNQACVLFGLTPEESFLGVTVHAARALNLAEQKGQLSIGADADLLLWDIESPAQLSYGINLVKPSQRWIDGSATA